MPRLDAAFVTSLPLWMAILSIPIGGFIVQRSATPRLIANLSYLAAAAALVALCMGVPPILACIAFGLAIGPGPGAIMAQPARVLLPHNRLTGLGIFGTVYAILGAVGPWLAGTLADATQTKAAALLLGAGLFMACLPLMALYEATLPARLRDGMARLASTGS
jgi:Uncharacterised MFS-type transporter YbfB